MKLDQEAYKKLVGWLEAHSGQMFKIREDGHFSTYFDSLNRERRLNVAPAKDPEKLLFHLKHHITERGKPNVIFINEDYSVFKVWKDGDNFFNYPNVYQERKMITIK